MTPERKELLALYTWTLAMSQRMTALRIKIGDQFLHNYQPPVFRREPSRRLPPDKILELL